MSRAAAMTHDNAPEPTRGAGVVIVPLGPDHLDQVLAIEAEVAGTGWSRGIFEREMVADATRCYLVALRPPAGGADARRPSPRPAGTPDARPAPRWEVVGYTGMQLQAGEAHITTMTVAPTHRRHGIATRLLAALLWEARARGAASAALEVRIDNLAARRLYAGMGFRPVGVRPKYYESSVDALIMWAHDIDGPEFARMLRERAPLPSIDAPRSDGGEA